MAVATLLDTEQSIWPPTTKHYAIDDGTFVLVEVDEDGPTPAMIAYAEQAGSSDLVPRPANFVKRPTVILPASTGGFATSLSPLHRLDPGTSHTDALVEAGYTVA